MPFPWVLPVSALTAKAWFPVTDGDEALADRRRPYGRAEAGVLASTFPFLDPDEALAVTFTTTGSGADAGRVVLTPPAR